MLKYPTLFNCFLITAAAILLTICKQESNSLDYNFERYFPLSIEHNNFFAQIAISQEELSQGLMFRNNLDKNHGMLFCFQLSKKNVFFDEKCPYTA